MTCVGAASMRSLPVRSTHPLSDLFPDHCQSRETFGISFYPRELRCSWPPSLDLARGRPVPGSRHTQDADDVPSARVSTSRSTQGFSYRVRLCDLTAILRGKDVKRLVVDGRGMRGLDDKIGL